MSSTIKLSEILAMINPIYVPIEGENDTEPNLDALESELKTGTCLAYSTLFNARVKARAINTWICTDTIVGLYAYYLDDHFIALSFQRFRKSSHDFKWVSLQAAEKVRALIHELSYTSVKFSVSLISADQDISADWLKTKFDRC